MAKEKKEKIEVEIKNERTDKDSITTVSFKFKANSIEDAMKHMKSFNTNKEDKKMGFNV